MDKDSRLPAITALSAVGWTSSLMTAALTGGRLVWAALRGHRLPRPDTIVLTLTTALAVLALSLLWTSRPLRQWSLDQHLIWISVAVVWAAIFGSWAGPWYFQWLAAWFHAPN